MPYKKIVFFTIVLVGIIIINNLAHSIYVIWQKQDLIIRAQNNLQAEKNENQKLKKAIAQVNKPEFIESQARNNLNLAKPNEEIVVIPTGTMAAKTSTSNRPKDPQQNWQKWWNYFFKS
ncbi:MAG: FtsB family cell division protein [Candidatus Levyibacteriota bacterium]